MSMKIKQLPEAERPYEKLELHGEKALSNAELLAIIIKTGTREETSVNIAQRILNLNEDKKEGLSFLKQLTLEELKKIKGIGRVKAIQLKALCELASRMTAPADYRKVKIIFPEDIAKLFMESMSFEEVEVAKLVILNNRNEIIKIVELTKGGENFTNIPLKDLLVEPIKMHAPKIALIHNHPSGDPTPSDQDIKITKNLKTIAEVLGIELIDHLIIGNMNYSSIYTVMIKRKIEF